jgi:Domain of unknown function (DUF4352)
MATTMVAPRRRVVAPLPRRRNATVVFVSLVGLLSVIGAIIAAQLMLTSANEPSDQVEGSVPTSFGTLTVHQSEVLNGLSSASLGGMSHGVQNLVAGDKAEVAVTVTLTNKDATRVRYAANQFRLISGGTSPTGKPVAPLGTSLSSGVLAKGGTVEGTVNFVTATNGSQLWLRYNDHGHPVLVRLGSTALPGTDTDGTPHPEH